MDSNAIRSLRILAVIVSGLRRIPFSLFTFQTLASFIVLALGVPHALAQVGIVTDNATVAQGYANVPLQGGVPLAVSGNSAPTYQTQNAYLRFDLSELTAGTAIGKATLVFYVNRAGCPGTGCQVTISQITDDPNGWTESNITYDNQPTALQSFATLPIVAANDFYTVDITSLVQGWLADPSTNNGLAMTAASTADLEIGRASCRERV